MCGHCFASRPGPAPEPPHGPRGAGDCFVALGSFLSLRGYDQTFRSHLGSSFPAKASALSPLADHVPPLMAFASGTISMNQVSCQALIIETEIDEIVCCVPAALPVNGLEKYTVSLVGGTLVPVSFIKIDRRAFRSGFAADPRAVQFEPLASGESPSLKLKAVRALYYRDEIDPHVTADEMNVNEEEHKWLIEEIKRLKAALEAHQRPKEAPAMTAAVAGPSSTRRRGLLEPPSASGAAASSASMTTEPCATYEDMMNAMQHTKAAARVTVTMNTRAVTVTANTPADQSKPEDFYSAAEWAAAWEMARAHISPFACPETYLPEIPCKHIQSRTASIAIGSRCGWAYWELRAKPYVGVFEATLVKILGRSAVRYCQLCNSGLAETMTFAEHVACDPIHHEEIQARYSRVKGTDDSWWQCWGVAQLHHWSLKVIADAGRGFEQLFEPGGGGAIVYERDSQTAEAAAAVLNKNKHSKSYLATIFEESASSSGHL